AFGKFSGRALEASDPCIGWERETRRAEPINLPVGMRQRGKIDIPSLYLSDGLDDVRPQVGALATRFHSLHLGDGGQKPHTIIGIRPDIPVADVLQPFHVVQYENARPYRCDVLKKCIRLDGEGDHGSRIEMANLSRGRPVRPIAALAIKHDIARTAAIDDKI